MATIWWVNFKRTATAPGAGPLKIADCYFGTRDEATAAASKDGEVAQIRTLPYPANGKTSPDGCPPFCYSPEQCAGRTCCPKSYACSE